MQPSDLELIQASQKGDQNAFRQLVVRHEPIVRSTVLGMLGSAPETEEVAQDVFVRFYRSMDQFQGNAKLGTYLTRIAINLSLNAIKARQRRQNRFAPWKDSVQEPVGNDHGKQLEWRELLQWAMGQLKEDQRTVAVLRLVDGYPLKEIAQILDIPIGTVASRLQRAQDKLRALLAPYRIENKL